MPFLKDTDLIQRALAWSAEYGRSKLVKRLLQHPGVDPNANVRGDPLLYLACKTLDRDPVIALIEAGADPCILSIAASDEFGGRGSFQRRDFRKTHHETRGFTPFRALCGVQQQNDNTILQELFYLLLQKGVPLGMRTDSGRTALHNAVHNPFLTRLLLRAGADTNVTDDNGHTPLHDTRSPESIALLVEEGKANVNAVVPSDGGTPVLRMLKDCNKDAIKKLLEYHPDLTIKQSNSLGPLHLALTPYSADITIVQALLDAGADPDGCNREGDTPLLAMRMDSPGAIDIVNLLLRLGADIKC
jgi:ankyrin repeat protein